MWLSYDYNFDFFLMLPFIQNCLQIRWLTIAIPGRQTRRRIRTSTTFVSYSGRRDLTNSWESKDQQIILKIISSKFLSLLIKIYMTYWRKTFIGVITCWSIKAIYKHWIQNVFRLWRAELFIIAISDNSQWHVL